MDGNMGGRREDAKSKAEWRGVHSFVSLSHRDRAFHKFHPPMITSMSHPPFEFGSPFSLPYLLWPECNKNVTFVFFLTYINIY